MAMSIYAERDHLLASEPPETQAIRYASFAKFAAEVDRINSDPSLPFTAENNFLSILTTEERQAYLGLNSSAVLQVGTDRIRK